MGILGRGPASLFPPDGVWDLRLDPVVGGFRLCSGDVLDLWSEEIGKWLPASEMEFAALAVAEAERIVPGPR